MINTRRESASQPITGMSALVNLVQHTCSNFIELRQGKAFLGWTEVRSGYARLACQTVGVLMLFEREASNENCAPPGAPKRLDGYAKIQHMFRLVRKFHHPIVVFVKGPASWPDMRRRTQPDEAFRFAGHILSQWHLEVPIILIVLSRSVSGNVFGAWLADKVLAFKDACFSMTMVDSVETHLVAMGACSLRDHGVIDGTIDATASSGQASPLGLPKPSQMSDLLSTMLKELSPLSSTELLRTRREKVELISRLGSNETQDISSSTGVMAGPNSRMAGAEVSVPYVHP